MEKMNPDYDSDKLGWETLEVEYGEPCYSFDTLKFWRTKSGEVYMAHDSGCSCPTPFEDYEGETEDEIKQKLERVGSIEQAKSTYDSHIEEYSKPDKSWEDVRNVLWNWGVK